MKKILSYLLLIFMIVFTGIISVNAASATISKNNFTWSDVSSYSSCRVSCSNAEINGGDFYSGRILKAASGSITITPTIKSGTVTCKIILDKDLAGNDRDKEIVAKSITIGTTTKPTTKKTTTKKTTTKTTTSSKSNNSNLKALIIKSQDGVVLSYKPDFKADTYEYTVDADSSVNKVTLQPSTEDSKANVVIEPSNYNNVTIKDGETTKIAIIVTAEDGVSKKTYNVNIKKTALNRDATLKSLTIAELPNFKFVSTQDTYDLPVSGNYKKLDIKCVPNNDKAKCVITGNENLKNGSIIRVVVTSESDTTKVYTLNIVRKVVTTEAQVNASGDKDPLIIIILSVVAVFLISAIIGVLRK